MSFLTSVKTKNDPTLISEFIRLSEQMVEFGAAANCQLIPFRSLDLPYFNGLTDHDKTKVINHLKLFNDICSEVLSEGKSLADSATLTWYGLKRLELRFPSDLFDHITNDHIVEVYDRENIQIFRNFKFFEVTSFSIEDLLCRPWVEIFVRANLEHTQTLVDCLGKFYTKEITSVTSLKHLGTQRLIEKDSTKAFEVDAVIEYLSPIYDKTRRPAGVVAIETAKVVHASVSTQSWQEPRLANHQVTEIDSLI
jgi:hypothetical protein